MKNTVDDRRFLISHSPFTSFQCLSIKMLSTIVKVKGDIYSMDYIWKFCLDFKIGLGELLFQLFASIICLKRMPNLINQKSKFFSSFLNRLLLNWYYKKLRELKWKILPLHLNTCKVIWLTKNLVLLKKSKTCKTLRELKMMENVLPIYKYFLHKKLLYLFWF